MHLVIRLLISGLALGQFAGATAQQTPNSNHSQAQSQADFNSIEVLAKSGDANAQFYLGQTFQHGQNVLQDYGLAAQWYRRAANAGHIEAITNLAGLTAEGLGAEKSISAAFALYQKAADQNYPPAQHIIGSMIEAGLGTEQPKGNAKDWYEKAANNGFAEAQTSLGVLYHQGDLIDQDYDLARQWYELAAAQGHLRAQNNLGLIYTQGHGVEQNYEMAAQYYTLAAQGGFQQAMTNLGVLYENGFGVPQSDETAREWYRKATEKNRSSRKSADLPDEQAIQDFVKSTDFDLKQLKALADRGDIPAQYVLGNLYLNGWKVPQDYVLAYKWINLSADSSASSAASLRDELQSRMTNRQLNAAQKLAREWQETQTD